MEKNIHNVKSSFRYAVVTVAAAFLCLSSCSNSHNVEIAYVNQETLRSVSASKENEVLWTREIESARLLQDIKKNAGVSDSISLSPLVAAVSESDGKKIYPEIPGFGSLDTSLISTELKSFLDEFCTSLSSWTLTGSQFEEASFFTLVLLKYDIAKNWQPNFGIKFPVEPENTAAEQNEETDEIIAGNSAAAVQVKLFDSWLYGKPFIEGSDFQIPVRFYCAHGIMDLLVYITDGNGFKITLLQIQKWEKRNGK